MTLYIKGVRINNLDCKDIKLDDEISITIDFTNIPTFSLKINKIIQPFCVVNIPNRVKFIVCFFNSFNFFKFIFYSDFIWF
jgi:hypothetical protein